MDFCEFEGSLLYRASSKTARAIQGDPVSKKQTKIPIKKKQISLYVTHVIEKIIRGH